MSWEVVIGLEVHAQLLTASKLFCGCPASYGAEPNENTCPVCMGFPGVLPVPNRRAVEFAIRTGLALGCEIAPSSVWARKNYFYPDLPKGYQISQYESPICVGGTLDVPDGDGVRTVRLTRIHMEEDAGKSIHDADPRASLVDLNRAGTPLLEIVSEPDIRSARQAADYLRELRSLLQYLEVCDGNMEQGSLRCDANVSLRRKGADTLGTRAEVKNMNSFRSVEEAVEYEIERQAEILESGGSVVQETRLWDADRGETRSMRTKEEAEDYRYFPDPDLPPLVASADWVERVRADLPELPRARRRRFREQHGLSEQDAEVLTARRDLADYFEDAVHAGGTAKLVANWVMESVIRVIREQRLDADLRITAWPVSPSDLGRLLGRIEDGTISGKIAKSVFTEMVESGENPDVVIDRLGLRQVSDPAVIENAVDEVLAGEPDKVAEFRAGKDKLLGYFVGQVMKKTQGKANPQQVNEILRRKLAGD